MNRIAIAAQLTAEQDAIVARVVEAYCSGDALGLKVAKGDMRLFAERHEALTR